MKFRFFTQRRKSSFFKDAAKLKMSRICCLHSPTEAFEEVEEPKDTSRHEDSTHMISQETQNANKRTTPRPLRCSPSPSSHTSSTSSIYPLEAIVSDPTEDQISRQNRVLKDFCEQFGFTASPNVPKSETQHLDWKERGQITDGGSVSSYTPSHGSSSARSWPKGPGLGSISDSPPSRMPTESCTQDLSNIFPHRQARRSDGGGANAPDLPTRLEVCNASTRSEDRPLLFDSVVSMHSERLDSHPIVEPLSPPGSSVSASSKERSPGKKVNLANSLQFAEELATAATGSCSHSSGPQSLQSWDSSAKGMSSDYPTKLLVETDGDLKRLIEEKIQCTSSNIPELPKTDDWKQQDSQDRELQLHQWHVHLRMEWVSPNSSDLVAEVFPLEETASQLSQSEIRSLVPTIQSLLKDQENKNVTDSFHDDSSIEAEIIQIVHCVLCELKNQRRRKSKPIPGINGLPFVEEVDLEENHEERLRPLPLVIKDKTPRKFQYLEPEQRAVHARFQQRLEMLGAFELLITRMENRIRFTEANVEAGNVPLETRLSVAILYDLRCEIMRLTESLYDPELLGEDFNEEMIPSRFQDESRTHRHSVSTGNPTLEAGFPEGNKSAEDHRPHSAFATAAQQMMTKPKDIISKNLPEYPQLPAMQQIYRNTNKTSRKHGTTDRIANMSFLTEESEFTED